MSKPTRERDATFARNVDAVATIAPDAKQAILARDTKIDRPDVKALATIATESPQAAKHILADVQAVTIG